MKKLLSLLIVISAAISCTDDDLKPEGDFTGDKIVGFGSNFASVAHFEDIGTVQETFPVNLIGLGNGQVSDEPITVNYEIVTAANAIGDEPITTAQEGVEFDFVDSSGQITIPAGGTFGTFPLNVNTGNFSPTEKTQLVLRLSGASDGTVVGDQFKTLRIVFVGCQSTIADEDGTAYTLVVTNNATGASVTRQEVLYKVGVNTFRGMFTGTYTPAQLAPATETGFDFIDICGDITVPEQNLANYWGNIVKGLTTDGTDGEVTSPTTFEITYEISFAAGNRTFTGVYTRNE